MRKYEISGVWKDSNGVITHYAIQEVTSSRTKVLKTSKSNAIALVGNPDNKVTTILWNYKTATWNMGESVGVVERKFLRSYPDGKASDNLAHLIDFDCLKL
jgi:hypothetical protein